jgi:hypothetical protein
MVGTLSDATIAALVAEPKPVDANIATRLQKLRAAHGHGEQKFDITGTAGSQFRVVVRQSASNPLNFSVILTYLPPGTNVYFRLRRYNGNNHEHTNRLEGSRISFRFHVHQATERYQAAGSKEDAFAEETARYFDLSSAVGCLLAECGFVLPPPPPPPPTYQGALELG